MTDTALKGSGTVKKETTIIMVSVALVVGFLGGVMYSAFNAGNGGVGQTPASAPKGASSGPSISPDLAQRMLSFEQAVAKDPQDGEAWTQLGHVYFDTNEYDKAINAYQKSLELLPDNADVLVDLGVMYRRNGQSAQAILSFDKAIAVQPGHETARFNKGIVLLYDLDDREGAMKAWQELLAINPNARAGNQSLAEMIKNL